MVTNITIQYVTGSVMITNVVTVSPKRYVCKTRYEKLKFINYKIIVVIYMVTWAHNMCKITIIINYNIPIHRIPNILTDQGGTYNIQSTW